ncbi:alpha-1,2-fucosyltransferase [Flavobacterium chungangense]|uniref:alpha-1,2-fucosyltransferase n=1 Tax=Flavobacterium chungangense TaxID=554283 RepID=UPI0004DEE306|nr:alpha-1,2-fucosyltransferase [Flavobacterium chungangense]
MLIIEVIGGLGNQMFQYAFYIALKEHYKNQEIKLYINRFNETSDNQGYEIEKVFDVKSEYFESDISNLVDDSTELKARIRRKFLGTKSSFFIEKFFKYDKNVLELSDEKLIYLRGLWQDELYFCQHRKILLNSFEFKKELDTINLKLLEEIKNSNSVSIHIRRGDYVSNKKYKNLLGDVCSYKYYYDALNYIKNRIDKLTLYVFSDDINWVKTNFDFLADEEVVFVSHNIGIKSYIDMQLMSNCKYNIIANSTFSWWGAWLNKNPSKMVLAPNKWFKKNKRLQDNHIVPDDWIKIDNL